MEKVGIANLKLVVMAVAQLAIIGDTIGHTSSNDRWLELLELRGVVKQLDGVDFKQVVPEMKDLDAAERAELLAAFNSKFAIQDKHLEQVIEDGLESVLELVAAGEKAFAFVNKLKDYGSDPTPAALPEGQA